MVAHPLQRVVAGTVAVAALTSACSSGSATSRTITVFAASSLTEAFDTLGARFERLHPGTRVRFDYDASSTLAEQIVQGAPADVFASAATSNMAQVTKAGDAGRPTTFVSNVAEIAVPPGNPAHITGIGDLAEHGVKVAVCDSAVPCGAVAQQVFANAALKVRPATYQPDVKSTLTEAELGEVDAAIVYVTDVRAAGAKVKGIPIPASVNAKTDYPIAALPNGHDPAGGRAFVQYVLSAAGRKVLAADGFRRP